MGICYNRRRFRLKKTLPFHHNGLVPRGPQGRWVTQKLLQDWPPPYRIKENVRARRVILRIRPAVGLVVTVPKGFDPIGIPGILEAHRSWIEENLAAAMMAPPRGFCPDILPQKIFLAAVDETWEVLYEPRAEAPVQAFWVAEPRPQIRIRGDVSHVAACCRLIREWLKDQGRRRLPPWVEELSRKTGLPYTTLTVRCQKTRWGSYSARGTLSLNAAVLLLPKALARFVILHELCHSRHTLHDAAFRDLLQRHEPDARRLDARLRDPAYRFPPWYTASFGR